MKYIQIHKEDNSEEEITKERALQILDAHYRDSEYVLQEAERLFGNRINTPFSLIEVR